MPPYFAEMDLAPTVDSISCDDAIEIEAKAFAHSAYARTDREDAQAGGALELAPGELQGDREVVMAAVQKNGWALQFAAEPLMFPNPRGPLAPNEADAAAVNVEALLRAACTHF